MRRMILCIGFLLFLGFMTKAQTIQHKTASKKHVYNKSKTNKGSSNKSDSTAFGRTVSLFNTEANKAYVAPPFNNNQLKIQDPTINALNAKANGEPVHISSSGIVGMPKSAYGFANGHLFLRSTGATSIGTVTGTGSVGTGTTPGSVGTNGSVIGVNGKNPNAGNSIWGTAITGPDPRLTDSLKSIMKKKQ
ncbi:MAG TPA: hypothetical protein VNS32_17785 [Flavisolibacter sp.]|nr:hypothetical protein [Flavisolibacter sp.]